MEINKPFAVYYGDNSGFCTCPMGAIRQTEASSPEEAAQKMGFSYKSGRKVTPLKEYKKTIFKDIFEACGDITLARYIIKNLVLV